MKSVTQYLNGKFQKKPTILEANIKALKTGYHFGETTETFTTNYKVKAAPLKAGTYRSITGNQALAYGLIAAAQKAKLPLFYGSYPITPASDILHYLSAQKNFGVKTFQAEDEIAAVCSAIGAAYGGNLAITGTSGPGLALKGEAIGLAMILELPMVIIDIQRGGPSTGLPTKTEQSDLLMAFYGRNGESPMPIISASTPSDAFEAAFEASRIAIQHMVPVMLLSDGYIANGAEPWRFPKAADLPAIPVKFAPPKTDDEIFLPYGRDENYVRQWAIPGTEGLMHRVGGLEKEEGTGNVSYDPANHEYMVKIREAKVNKIADFIPEQKIEIGEETGDLLVLGWGSTFGVIKSVVNSLIQEGHKVAHAHVRYMRPFPKNFKSVLNSYKKILIPEINNGQLSKIIRDKFLIDVYQYNKIQGIPITKAELKHAVKELLND